VFAVRIAEDPANIDSISNGRFDLGLGQGFMPGERAAYGFSRKRRPRRLEEESFDTNLPGYGRYRGHNGQNSGRISVSMRASRSWR
jgi:hypothetical protein